jgi:hypothetical protein
MDTINAEKLCNSAGVATPIAVASTADVYSHTRSIKDGSNFVLWYKATVASGTPDVDLYLQQGFQRPTAEGSAGTATDGFINIGSKVADITDEAWHYVVLSPVSMPFLRILLDGQGSNPATCTVDLRLGKQSALGV